MCFACLLDESIPFFSDRIVFLLSWSTVNIWGHFLEEQQRKSMSLQKRYFWMDFSCTWGTEKNSRDSMGSPGGILVGSNVFNKL